MAELDRAARMHAPDPLVSRNHLLSQALVAISQGDLATAEKVVSSSVEVDLTLSDVFAHYQIELETQNQELRQAQVLTESALAWTAQLFRSLPVAAVLVNSVGVIVDVNTQAEHELGLSRANGCNALPMRRLLASSEAEYRWAVLMGQITAGRSEAMDEVPLRTLWGEERWVDLRVMQMPPRDGQPGANHCLCIINDRTQQIEAQQARERVRQAEQQRDLAQTASETKSRLMARVSHEFRTPLNAVIGFSNLLLVDAEHLSTDKARRWVNHIHLAGSNLLALVDEVLEINKSMAVKAPSQLAGLHLGELVRSIAEMMMPVAQRVPVQLTIDVPPGPMPLAQGHERRVREVLINLVSNAIKYNIANGWVRVTAGAGPVRAWVCVADSGVGLSADQQAHLFEPFNRLGAEMRDDNGHGLGLVVAKTHMETMGGRLTVQSTQGVGSSFTMELPLWRPVPADADAALPVASGQAEVSATATSAAAAPAPGEWP